MSYSAFKSYEPKSFQGEVTPTSNDHIFIVSNALTIRGITYNVSGHFYKRPTGEWGLGPKSDDAPATTYYHQLSAHRRTDNYAKLHDVSHKARLALAEALTAEITSWVKDNPDALIQAQQEYTAREVEKREQRIAEHEASIATLRLEIVALEPEGEAGGAEQKEFTTRDLEILDLLWDSLKRDPEHKDRRQTGWGTKTRVGLIACIDRLTK
jgi:hypothetical protein